MKRLTIVTIFSLFVASVLLLFVIQFAQSADNDTTQNEEVKTVRFDLDLDGKSEKLTIVSTLNSPGYETTKVFVNNALFPDFSLSGYFYRAQTHIIREGDWPILEFQLLTGHSITSLLYTYESGRLKRIPISTENSPYYEGVISRTQPKFLDVNHDGSLEMVVSYSSFTSDEKKQIELYSYQNKSFVKYEEYEIL